MALRLGPVGKCIYCGAIAYAPDSDRRLAPEHIVPYGLNGDIELLEASCRACERVTGRVESITLKGHLLGSRAAMGMKSRKGGLKDDLPLFVGMGGREKVTLPPEDCPALLLLPQLPDPAMLWALNGWGLPAYDHPPFLAWFNYKPDVLRGRYGIDRFAAPWMNSVAFCRMVAKIGHAVAVADWGLKGFTPFLDTFLRDPDMESRSILPFVGGTPPNDKKPGEHGLLHELQASWHLIEGRTLLISHVRLFAKLGAPTYVVLVGSEAGKPPPPLPDCSVGVDALHKLYRIDVRVD